MPPAPLLADVRVPPARRDESLAMKLTYAPSEAFERGAIIAGPLPFLGGDMDNNVVRTLAHAMVAGGLPALRYDYRSVGDSRDVTPGEARYDTWRHVEETGNRAAIVADAAEALRRAHAYFTPSLLAGYSFGCWTAVRTAAWLPSPVPLVLVAPPLARIDIADVASHAAPVLLVLAGDDTLAPPPSPDELRARFPRARVVVLDDADHFFRGREDDLAAVVRGFLGDLPVAGALSAEVA